MRRGKARRRGGFSLVEMLLVLAIVSFLSAASLTAINTAKDSRMGAMKAADARVLLSTVVEVMTHELRFGTFHGGDSDHVVLESDFYGKGWNETTMQNEGISIRAENGVLKAGDLDILGFSVYRSSGQASASGDDSYSIAYSRLYVDMSFGGVGSSSVSVTIDVKDGSAASRSLCKETIYVRPLNP